MRWVAERDSYTKGPGGKAQLFKGGQVYDFREGFTPAAHFVPEDQYRPEALPRLDSSDVRHSPIPIKGNAPMTAPIDPDYGRKRVRSEAKAKKPESGKVQFGSADQVHETGE